MTEGSVTGSLDHHTGDLPSWTISITDKGFRDKEVKMEEIEDSHTLCGSRSCPRERELERG